MTFASDQCLPPNSRPSVHVDDHDDGAFSQTEGAGNSDRGLAARMPFFASSSSSSTELNSQVAERPSSRTLLYPHTPNYSNPSLCSTVTVTPMPSRTTSPLYAQDDSASSCSSDSEEGELESSLLHESHRRSFSLTETPRWWANGPSRRRRRDLSWLGTCRWGFRRFVLPFIPKTPLTIIFTLLVLTAFSISLTYLIIYLCNPDKEPLPWRGYCTIPNYSTEPPPSFLGAYASFPIHPPSITDFAPTSFPPDNLDSLSPAGIFVGVFSMDTGFERRMLIRSTYASHARSRNGAGEGDGGVGTSRTVVRFIMGRPRKDWEQRIHLEMQTYNDIIILPIKENMNDGKTYSFFSWAATGAWVPPLYSEFDTVPQNLSYANLTSPAPILANHDPILARQDAQSGSPKPWVPPDFIIKADDDSFVMLAELEAHLRVELHGGPLPRHYNKSPVLIAPPASSNQSTVYHAPNDDPLIYWGYTVKNRFMGGELYALSHSLVDWISKDPGAKEHVTGAEDQVTARWVRWHPRADDVRWVRERCWIYDHPKAGTVYSRGFLFPSEAKRVQTGIISDIQRWYKSYKSYKSPLSPGRSSSDVVPEDFVPVFGPHGETPSSWVLSSVSTFQVRYSPPVPGLSSDHSIEALVEGSDMSRLTKWNATAADEAWQNREGRIRRYEGKRVGGTTVVHSIKKHLWFLEAATALLEGEDYTEGELAQGAAEASPHFAELAATWDR